MHAITVDGCGLPAMPTRLRTVEDDVNTAASNCPPLIASRMWAAGGAARVEPELLELLAHRLHGVDRGEADPLVATGDQALDRALHLLRRPGRLDRDRRDDLGGGAVGLEPGDGRPGLLLGARHQD